MILGKAEVNEEALGHTAAEAWQGCTGSGC